MRLEIAFLVLLISFGKLCGHESRHDFLKASEFGQKNGRVVLNFNINVFGNGSVSGSHGEEITGKDGEETQAATIALNVRKFQDSKTGQSQKVSNVHSALEADTNTDTTANSHQNPWNGVNAQSANIAHSAAKTPSAVDALYAGNANRYGNARNAQNVRNGQNDGNVLSDARRAANADRNVRSAARARLRALGLRTANSAHRALANARNNAKNAQRANPARISETGHSATWTAAANARRGAHTPNTADARSGGSIALSANSDRVGAMKNSHTAPKAHGVNDALSANEVEHAASHVINVNNAADARRVVNGQNVRKAHHSVANDPKPRKRSTTIPKSFLLEFSPMCHDNKKPANQGSITLKEVEPTGERSWESGLRFLKSGKLFLTSGAGCYKAYYFKIPRSMRVSFVEVDRKEPRQSIFGSRPTIVVVSHRNVLYFYNQSPFNRRPGMQRVTKCSLFCGRVPKTQVEKIIHSLER